MNNREPRLARRGHLNLRLLELQAVLSWPPGCVYGGGGGGQLISLP